MRAIAVALVDRSQFRSAMVEPAGERMHVLMQRAAEGDVELLDTAADRQHRQIGLHRRVQQRQHDRIARRIVQRAGQAGRARIMMRLDIGGRARHQQPVDARDKRVGPIGIAFGRDQERHAAGAVQHGVDIFLYDSMAGMIAGRRCDLAAAARNADDGERSFRFGAPFR